MNNLIVESKVDQAFIEALLRHYQNDVVVIDAPICHIDDFECMSGLNDGKLRDALSNLKNQMVKKDIQKVGIIIDNDDRAQERLEHINKAVRAVFHMSKEFTVAGEFLNVSTSIDNEIVNLQLGCFLMGIDNSGELETVLREIAKAPAPYADCLKEWENCVRPSLNKDPFTPKEFRKLWIHTYVRYDTCDDPQQAGKKCSFSEQGCVHVLNKDIWDFDSAVLADLKAFLNHFD